MKFSLMALLIGTNLAYAAAPPPPAPPPLTTLVKNVEGEALLANSFNKTLYVFDVDQGKATSACNGGCSEIWPPYILSAAESAAVKAPFGVVQRTSQQPQLTFNGRPVYTYAFDREAGDDQGNGLGNVWHYIEQKVN
jgi:predicted lipoprotein with Yx(FWY)xxD motif